MSKKKINSLKVGRQEGETKGKALAKAVLDPVFKAAHTALESTYNYGTDLDINEIANTLRDSANKLKTNNLEDAETLLITQAHILDTLFHKITRMALKHDTLKLFQGMFTVALKAQSQSRMTLETLAEIKNPRPYIQNNKAEYQQVNNNGQARSQPHAQAGKNSKSTNGLLEDKRHETEWLDTGAPETAGGNDKELEAVETKHRAKDR